MSSVWRLSFEKNCRNIVIYYNCTDYSTEHRLP